jgi:outer membrane protein OmpA-like peptidoglycan-associated protein
MSALALAVVLIGTQAAAIAAAPSQSGDFATGLAAAYQQLADLEKAQGDHRDADAYAARAAAASAGNPTAPDQVELRHGFLEPRYLAELSDARQRLMAAFEQGGRDKAAGPAARAQSSFDCWLEQASEDLQPGHIDACKQAYLLAVADVEEALIPPPPPPPVVDPDSDADGVPDSRDDCPGTAPGTPVDAQGCPKIPSLEGVHFEHDKAVLTASARSILDHAASIMESNPYIRVEIVGHTDSSGSDAYNQALSERRAESARAYLQAAGVSSSRLLASGRGEGSPIADNDTPAGRAANRRVELTARPID